MINAMKVHRVIAAVAALAAAVLGSGCLNTGLSGQGTVILGQVTDLEGNPIPGVNLALVYDWNSVSRGPAPAVPVAADPVTLDPPYPDPLINPSGIPLNIRVHATADTTARIEIWGMVSGAEQFLATVAAPVTLSGTGSWTWDGAGGMFPNGLYQVRVVVPAGAPRGKGAVLVAPFLINRPANSLDLGPFNAFTAADGTYDIADIPIGEPFTHTDDRGAVLGPAVVAERVALLFRPGTGYQPLDLSFVIGVGEQVEKSTSLAPFGKPRRGLGTTR